MNNNNNNLPTIFKVKYFTPDGKSKNASAIEISKNIYYLFNRNKQPIKNPFNATELFERKYLTNIRENSVAQHLSASPNEKSFIFPSSFKINGTPFILLPESLKKNKANYGLRINGEYNEISLTKNNFNAISSRATNVKYNQSLLITPTKSIK